jgi:hypothetical protein
LLERIGTPPLNRRFGSDKDVVFDVQRPEQLEALERARHAQPGAAVSPETSYVPAFEHDPTSIGTAQPGQDIEKRCLSGAVRADQTRDGTRCHWNRYLLQGLHAAEADRDLSGLEQASTSSGASTDTDTDNSASTNTDHSVRGGSGHFRRHRRSSRPV